MSLPVASRLLRRALQTQLVPVANIASKPAKNNITAADQAIGITVLFGLIMAPSCWILAHLEDYKKK